MCTETMKKLHAPFKPEEIEWRVGSTNADKTKGLALAYVTNRAIQNRLDEVFGCFGWQNSFKEWKGNSQICGISVYDAEKQQWVTKWDGADDSATEAIKGGLSDSMKRAACQWGIGRYLYKLESVWVDIKQQGKSYVIVKEPTLPKWALPPEILSDEQIKRAYAIATANGFTGAQVKEWIMKKWNKTSVNDLTKKEYDELTKALDKQNKAS